MPSGMLASIGRLRLVQLGVKWLVLCKLRTFYVAVLELVRVFSLLFFFFLQGFLHLSQKLDELFFAELVDFILMFIESVDLVLKDLHCSFPIVAEVLNEKARIFLPGESYLFFFVLIVYLLLGRQTMAVNTTLIFLVMSLFVPIDYVDGGFVFLALFGQRSQDLLGLEVLGHFSSSLVLLLLGHILVPQGFIDEK